MVRMGSEGEGALEDRRVLLKKERRERVNRLKQGCQWSSLTR